LSAFDEAKGAGQKAVERKKVRDILYKSLPNIKEDSKRKAMNRAISTCKEDGLISTDKTMIYDERDIGT